MSEFDWTYHVTPEDFVAGDPNTLARAQDLFLEFQGAMNTGNISALMYLPDVLMYCICNGVDAYQGLITRRDQQNAVQNATNAFITAESQATDAANAADLATGTPVTPDPATALDTAAPVPSDVPPIPILPVLPPAPAGFYYNPDGTLSPDTPSTPPDPNAATAVVEGSAAGSGNPANATDGTPSDATNQA